MIITRSMDYPQLLRFLEGGNASLWSCGTCARICGLAGEDGMMRLAERLREDGVDVLSVQSVSASCLQDRIVAKADLDALNASDAVVAICCDVGAETLAGVIDTKVLNPVVTLGQGSRDAGGTLIISRPDIADLPAGITLPEACRALLLPEGPFVG